MDKLTCLTDTHLFRGQLSCGDDQDFDIIALAKRSEKLTFNKKYLQRGHVPLYYDTPFHEIRFTGTDELIPKGYDHLYAGLETTVMNFNEFCGSLIDQVINYFTEHINPDEKYLVLHSAGFDSRIMSLALMYINKKHPGFCDNFHFRCHQPEGPMFMEIMRRQGWNEKQYSLYEGPFENYYNIAREDLPLNGWQNYNQQMKFWNDIVPESQEKDWNLIIGLGGEVFKYIASYPTEKATLCGNRPLHLLLNHNPGHGEWEGLYLRWFKSLLMPFFSYDYLQLSTRVNPSWCKFNGETDSVRYGIVRRFIDIMGVDCLNIPYGKHSYSWNLNKTFNQRMKKAWLQSRFYQDHGHSVKVSDFTTNMYGFEAKIWGFMTVYDAIFQNR